jgi:hypothetical protein
MDNFQAPNLVGIIMQALEQHITALVDKRFNERMADFEMPSMDDVKNALIRYDRREDGASTPTPTTTKTTTGWYHWWMTQTLTISRRRSKMLCAA